MQRRTALKRTPWLRKLPPTETRSMEIGVNQSLAHMKCARAAINSIVVRAAKMAQIDDLPHTPCPKAPKPWRSRAYRMLVAKLECYHCRLHGYSQAAHPNSGKTKGVKACDSLVFPMCTVGGRDCHGLSLIHI